MKPPFDNSNDDLSYDELEQKMMISQIIETLTSTYETIDNEALQLKIKAKISELVDKL